MGRLKEERKVCLDCNRLAAFAARRWGFPRQGTRVRLKPLHGGLEAVAVARVDVSCTHNGGRNSATFVIKRISAENQREVAAYKGFLADAGLALAPRFLGAERARGDTLYLYLEWISAWRQWPWRDTELAALVLRKLAHLHCSLTPDRFSPPLASWDYEAELLRSGVETVHAFERIADYEELAPVRYRRPALSRLVTALPAIRRQLAADWGPTVLHGDAHPGNALIRAERGRKNALLLDWARTRLGSALEDVGSWLQSLGYWEPEAKRRHDTLLQQYLMARGLAARLGASLREHYWLAAASNGLAGALRYHLLVAGDTGRTPAERSGSARAVLDWFRILRRALACWRN